MKKSVKQIIENVKEFHHELCDSYKSLKEQAVDKKAEMLLDYLSKNEEFIAQHLDIYLHDTCDKTLNRWINAAPGLPTNILCYCQKNKKIAAPISVDDAIDIAFHYDDCLVDFLTIITNETEDTKASEIFQKLLKQAQNEEKRLARNSQLLIDM